MATIREILRQNLIELRGVRRLKEIAQGAGIPYRTYQNMEDGVIPQDDTLAKIAAYYCVPETRLFLDPALAPAVPECRQRAVELALVSLLRALRDAGALSCVPVPAEVLDALGIECATQAKK